MTPCRLQLTLTPDLQDNSPSCTSASVAVAARQVTVGTAAHDWRPRRKVDPEVVHLARGFGRDHGGALGRCCCFGGGRFEVAQPCKLLHRLVASVELAADLVRVRVSEGEGLSGEGEGEG